MIADVGEGPKIANTKSKTYETTVEVKEKVKISRYFEPTLEHRYQRNRPEKSTDGPYLLVLGRSIWAVRAMWSRRCERWLVCVVIVAIHTVHMRRFVEACYMKKRNTHTRIPMCLCSWQIDATEPSYTLTTPVYLESDTFEH